MKKLVLIFTITVFLFGTCFSKTLAAQESEHQSLFFKSDDISAIKQNIANSEWMSQAYEVFIGQANEMMEYGPEFYAYSASNDQNYTHAGNGDWKKHGLLGRILEKRVGTLGIAGYLSGDQRYFNKAIEIMITATEAGDPDEWFDHLQQSDGARAYAIGYDLLYPYMNKSERLIVKNEIDMLASILYQIIITQENIVFTRNFKIYRK